MCTLSRARGVSGHEQVSPPAGPPGSSAAGELAVAVLSPKERARRCSLRALRKALDDATKPVEPSPQSVQARRQEH